MKVSYKQTDDPCGVAITDQIKQRRLQVLTDEPVSPTPTDAESFEFPVDVRDVLVGVVVEGEDAATVGATLDTGFGRLATRRT